MKTPVPALTEALLTSVSALPAFWAAGPKVFSSLLTFFAAGTMFEARAAPTPAVLFSTPVHTVPMSWTWATRFVITRPEVAPRSVNFETRGPSGPWRAARAVTAASTGVGRFAKAAASSAPAVATGARAERTETRAGARGERFVRNVPRPFAPDSKAGERSLISRIARSASCFAVEARIFSPGLKASPNALPALRSSGLAAIRAATPTVRGPMAEASWPITGIGWRAKVMRAAVVPPIRGV